MNFTQETIEEAIAKVYELGLIGASQKAVTALIISNCAQIEGDKIRADYEARYRKDDSQEWLAVTAA